MTFRKLRQALGRMDPSAEATPEAVLAILASDPDADPAAEFVRHARARLGMTQGELARELGVSEIAVRKWCDGQHRLLPARVDAILALLARRGAGG